MWVVEYLRWMRPYSNDEYREGTKLQIMQQAIDKADYRNRLQILCDRIKLIAGKDNYFEVKCPWRIRVGGHRGPESILLPAFDALGMPYIPSATLRGIARNQAIQEKLKTENLSWQEAEKAIAPYFGSLETDNIANQAGKITFIDAYPTPTQTGGLSLDMANNIWQWDNHQLKYQPNPNIFYSLNEPTFLIGVRLASNCQDTNILNQVKKWLIAGLANGIGAQVNTGYGQLLTAGKNNPTNPILKVQFTLEGQLIHGYQTFDRWDLRGDKYRVKTNPNAEVRTTALKSMLRYWFRVISLGVLSPDKVKQWETQLFGGINPQKYGWVKFNLENGKIIRREARNTQDEAGEETGTLIITYSYNAPDNQYNAIAKLFRNLTWLMFNLGGVGQGARRPCYQRNRSPYYRGCTIYIDTEDDFWSLGDDIKQSCQLYKQRFQDFYNSLRLLTGETIDYQNRLSVGNPTQSQWLEALDSRARVIICAGKSHNNKPFPLAILHGSDFTHNGVHDQYLCGTVRPPTPSPVWIVDSNDGYQIVTIFGATTNPRKQYIQKLKDESNSIYGIL